MKEEGVGLPPHASPCLRGAAGTALGCRGAGCVPPAVSRWWLGHPWTGGAAAPLGDVGSLWLFWGRFHGVCILAGRSRKRLWS